MSGVYLVVCHSCSYSQGFKFGIGARYARLESAVCLVSPERQSHVNEIISHNQISETDFGYHAFHCPNCKSLYDDFWVRVKQDDHEIFETKVSCRKCGDQMQSVREPGDINMFPCPHCYRTNLETIRIMPWD